MRDARSVAERRILSWGGEIGYRRHSGVDVSNNNDDNDDDDDDDNDDAKDDDDAENGGKESQDDSSACKRITLRDRTKTANPVILFQTRRRTAASRKESKRSTTSN